MIIHANLMPAPLLERAAKIGLHLAMQPPLLHWEQEPRSYLTRILGDRAYSLMPLKSMLDHGLTIAGGSDAPCSLPDAISGIHAACNHPNPEQRISILDAIRMHNRTVSPEFLARFGEHDLTAELLGEAIDQSAAEPGIGPSRIEALAVVGDR